MGPKSDGMPARREMSRWSRLVGGGRWEAHHRRARPPMDGLQSNTGVFVSARPLAKQARSDYFLGMPS